MFRRTADPAKGHVAFYLGETPAGIKILGGNQDNQLMVGPYAKERVVAYRWPRGG